MASWQMCWHRANTFVLVFGIVNTSGCTGFASPTGLLWLLFGWLLVWVGVGLGGVSPPFNRNPWLRTTQVLSGAYHVHTHMSIYCAPGTQQQWCSFAATQRCLPACWGLCNSCGQHTKGSGMAGAAYAAPGKLWGPLECPQWWLHALRSVHYCFHS